MKIKFFSAVIAIAFSLILVIPAGAEETLAPEYTAEAEIYVSSGESGSVLTDGSETTFVTVPAGGDIVVTREGISALYVKFHLRSNPWKAECNGVTAEFGENGFLHEYVLLPATAGSVKMSFPEETQICEIRIFGEGEPPDDVQVWETSYEKADVLLLSSHSDDEQLFFAGLIPYCAANDIDLQVVYFCYHDNVPVRLHEQLNGLWAAGATHYPVIGRFPDLYSESLEGALNAFSAYGYTREDFVAYQCELIRLFKPEVVVAHDVNGEYGHGTHRLNTSALTEALELTADPSAYPESAEKYGTWDVPKTYVHLWEERQIVMNYDEPLEYFGGRTAYEMSVEGYGCHNSQHWTWFTDWLVGTDEAPITAASQITQYSPCNFGLYRTTVGDDTEGYMFENVTLRKDIPPETTAPETDAPEETTVANTAESALTGNTEDDPSKDFDEEPGIDNNTLNADVIFMAAVAFIVICGAGCVIFMRKK